MTLKRIISSDIRREQRIPPGQVETKRWPVLHYGPVPGFDPSNWNFRIFGLVENELSFTWPEFSALNRIEVQSDIHCVTTWSKLDNLWEGISVHDLAKKATLKKEAAYVIAHCEYGFTANLPLKDFLEDDVLIALKHNGEDLTPEHGYPARLLVPKLYFWKSAKWLRGLEFSSVDKAGFWEKNGYHMHGDPWTEERMWI